MQTYRKTASRQVPDKQPECMRGKSKKHTIACTDKNMKRSTIDLGVSIEHVSCIPAELYVCDEDGDVIFPAIHPDSDDQLIYLSEALPALLQSRGVDSASYIKKKLQEDIGLKELEEASDGGPRDNWWETMTSTKIPLDTLVETLEQSQGALQSMDAAFDAFNIILQECHRQMILTAPKHAQFIERIRLLISEYWSNALDIAKFERQLAMQYLLSASARERELQNYAARQEARMSVMGEELLEKETSLRISVLNTSLDDQIVLALPSHRNNGANDLADGLVTSTVLSMGHNHLYRAVLEPGMSGAISVSRDTDLSGGGTKAALLLLGAYHDAPTTDTSNEDLLVAPGCGTASSGTFTLNISAPSHGEMIEFFALVCCRNIGEHDGLTDALPAAHYSIFFQASQSPNTDGIAGAQVPSADVSVQTTPVPDRQFSAACSSTRQHLVPRCSNVDVSALPMTINEGQVVKLDEQQLAAYVPPQSGEPHIWPKALLCDLAWLLWIQRLECFRAGEDLRKTTNVAKAGLRNWLHLWFMHYFGSATLCLRLLASFHESLEHYQPFFTTQSAHFVCYALGVVCGLFETQRSSYYRLEYEEFVCGAIDVIFSHNTIASSLRPGPVAEISREAATAVINLMLGHEDPAKTCYRKGMLDALDGYFLHNRGENVTVDTFLQILVQEWELYRAHALQAIQVVLVDTLRIPFQSCQGVNDLVEVLSRLSTGSSLSLPDQKIVEMFIEAMDPVTLEVSPSMLLEMIHFHKLCRATANVHDEDGRGGRQHMFRATPKVDLALLQVAVDEVGSCLDAKSPETSHTKNECSTRGSMDQETGRMLAKVKAKVVHATEENAHLVWPLVAELSRFLPRSGDNDKLSTQQMSAVESF